MSELSEIIARKRAEIEAAGFGSLDQQPIPVLRPGTIVRIAGPDVLYVVNKGLETDGPTATLTFTTIDGLDWYEERPKPAS